MKKLVSAGIAALCLAGASGSASAQGMPLVDAEGNPVEIGPAVLYAAPLAIQSVRTTCADTLPADGFFATQGEALEARYTEAAEGTWPQAKDILVDLSAGRGSDDSANVLAALPDEALQPFIDAMIPTLIATELKPSACTDIEAVMEQLAPLPPENLAGLVDVIIGLVERDRASKRARLDSMLSSLEGEAGEGDAQ